MITPSFSPTATERVLPRLALDFTTGVLDSRVTVTRALNTATRVNSSGYIEGVNADLPRFDYNPVTLAPKGLLIEESRANLWARSNEFNSWTKTRSTVDSDVIISPNGIQDGDKLVCDTTTSATHRLENNVVTVSGSVYTMSVFAKAAELPAILLREESVSTGAFFDLVNGVVGSVVAGTTATIAPFGNGWYRCTITYTQSGTLGRGRIELATAATTNSNVFTGNGVDGVYLADAQWELGAFPTSYIPTTTTSLTRNTDVVSMTGTNFSDWYNANEGTFVARAANLTTSAATRSIFDVRSATTIRMSLATFGASATFAVVDTTTQASLEGTSTVAENTFFQIAGGYKANNFGCAANGGATATDTAGTVPAANIAWIGGINGTSVRNGWVSNIWYYPQKLTSAEISAFSKQG